MDNAPSHSRLTAAASLLAALGLLVGVPAVLAAVVGWPLPRQMPDLAAIRDAFDRGDVDPQVLTKALAVVVWVAWAQLAWAIVVEAIAHVRGGVARARGFLPGTQHLARQLVASAALVLTTLTPARVAVAAPLDPAMATVAPDLPDRPAATPTTRTATAPQPANRPYTVEAGDSWWGLAQRFLGSGTRWSEVRDLNTGRQVAPGRTLGDREDTLLVGWTIAIPTDTSGAPAAAVPVDKRVVARPGDNLWNLATDHLARTLGREPTDQELGRYWQATLEANSGPGVGDPSVIAVGQELVLPPTPTVAEDAADSATPMPGGERIVTVTPGDSPWSLAEANLGDGTRWPELLTANQGRIQPDGRIWETGDAIHPGYQLVIPTAAPASAAPRTPATAPARAPAEAPGQPTTRATPPPSAPVAPTPDDEAPTRPEPPPAAEAEEPSDEPGSVSSPSTTAAPTAGNGDHPADRYRDLPEAPEASRPSAPATTSTTAPSTTEAPAASIGTDQPPGPDIEDEDRDGTVPAAPVLGVASTVLAVALLRSLRRRRARRAAHLPVTVVPPPPPTSSRPSASEIVGAAGEAVVDRLDAALAHLAAQLRPRGGEPCPQPRLVQVTDERIEVLLDHADPAPPPPWHPEASGQVWVLDSDIDMAPADCAAPVPALVTIGTGDSDILIDLEAFGVVALLGDADACSGLARSIVTELAARAEGTLGIDVIGLNDPHLDGLDGVQILDSWDDADTGVIAGSARMLDAGRWPHTFAARASGRVFDGWAPAVFVTAATDHPNYHEAVEQAGTRPGAGSAIVVVGADQPLGYGIRIVVDGEGQFHIPELGLTGQAQHLAADVVEQVVDLLDDADHLPVAETFDFPLDNPDADAGRPRTAQPLAAPDAPYEDPDWDVLVRVCGEIHVEGGKDRLPAREMAVATYVVLNRTADIDQLRDAVWAGTDISRKRVQNVVSTVRATLGRDAIYYVDEGRLAASPALVTDLSLVERRLAYARHQDDPHDRADTLRDALAWATGKVCTYPSTAGRAWRWIDLDNWIATVESTIGTVAYELANLYIELGDSDGAIWAARRGLDATGPREQLTLLLVSGYELAGDTPAAAATLRSYERYMDDLGTAEHSEALLAAIDRLLPPRQGRAAS